MSDKKGIVKRFSSEALIASPECVEKIVKLELDLDEIIREARSEGILFVSDEFLERFIETEEEIEAASEEITVQKEGSIGSAAPGEPKKASTPGEEGGIEAEGQADSGESIFIPAKQMESRLEIKTDSDVTNKSTSDGSIENFLEYFNKKFELAKSIIQQRMNFRSNSTVNAIGKSQERTAQTIIVMVTEKRESKKGYLFLEVEDPTGSLTVMLEKDKPQLKLMFDSILLDEVIGIQGVKSNNLFIANEICQPDIPFNVNPHYAEKQVYAALLSDIHVGSYLFMEKEFRNFIEWVNLKHGRKDIAERLKYILIAGDLVDGIGIYPNQEKELIIPDIYEQYDHFASLLENIPDYIEVVCCMGNHDAVRLAEPQPQLPKDLGKRLYGLSNVHVTGNPISLKIEGVEILMYHGTTLDSVIGNLSSASYRNPETAMVEYLKRRHLAPTFGRDNIAPETTDYMAISEVPDILHCGHVHTNGFTNYRGVKIINSGTFQGRTKYQEQLGHEPTPARVPVINLQNHEVSILHFDS
ncbi:MAG: DNA-directed DNA polymerase II small subunit [Candidatus Altiarchaeota archaeon]